MTAAGCSAAPGPERPAGPGFPAGPGSPDAPGDAVFPPGISVRSGVDLIRATRIRTAVGRRGDRLMRRIWTDAERADCDARQGQSRWLALAARFAAKEAVAKALGTGLLGTGGVQFTDIEVRRCAGGAPEVRLSGAARACWQALSGVSIAVSLTHEGDLAMAVCTLLCAPAPGAQPVGSAARTAPVPDTAAAAGKSNGGPTAAPDEWAAGLLAGTSDRL